MTPADSQIPVLVHIQLVRAASSPRTSRYLGALQAMDITAIELEALAAIVIVETSQRPSWVRGFEWTVRRIGGRLGLPADLLPRSVGPLQLVDAPASFAAAVHVAQRKLDGHLDTLDDVAAEWYGSRHRSAGSSASYSAALRQAAAIWRATQSQAAIASSSTPTPGRRGGLAEWIVVSAPARSLARNCLNRIRLSRARVGWVSASAMSQVGQCQELLVNDPRLPTTRAE